jgi:hypothetical protein
LKAAGPVYPDWTQMRERLEDRIRDFLVGNLESLEKGLTPYEKEFALANPSGSGGRVDIVAKDRFGHFVVIEIKRSDQAARDALHELHKYTALFRLRHGLDQTQVRIMVVSTSWHELLVPLSEYAASSPYTVDGIEIRCEPDGTVTNAKVVSLMRLSGALAISRAQAIYLFTSHDRRDAAAAHLSTTARDAHVTDFAIFAIDYAGNNPAVCYPSGLYFVFASPMHLLSAGEISKLKRSMRWDDELDLPEENFLASINERFLGAFDDFEIGYPEKLTNIRQDWRIEIPIREGRLNRSSSPLTDEDILCLAQAVGGGGSTYLRKVTSPRFQAEWGRLRTDLESVLLGIPDWQTQVPAFLDEAERNDPTATVSISVYNPANLLIGLYSLAARRTLEYCPSVEIVVEASTGKELRILCGVLMWTGQPIAVDGEGMITKIYGGLSEWMIATHVNETWEFEPVAMEAHGIVAPLVEFVSRHGIETAPQRLTIDDSTLKRIPFANDFASMAQFSEANQPYLESLIAYLEAHSTGLRRPGPEVADNS